MSCNIGKLMTKQKNQTGNVLFSKNVFDLNQKHFQVFHFLKNTNETSGETQKT